MSVQAALRWNQYKLITGSPGRHTGWDVPPTKMHGNASSIFDKVELPEIAYIDNIKAPLDDLEFTDEEKSQIRARRSKSNRSSINRSRRESQFKSNMSEKEADLALLAGSKSKMSLAEKIAFKKQKQLKRKKEKAGKFSINFFFVRR